MTAAEPMSRAERRDQTRAQIVDAAVLEFAAHGYEGASTRGIAARAGVTQGLVTYHFDAKDDLWRAAADRIFGQMADQLGAHLALGEPPGTAAARRERGREAIRAYVRFSAAHPEVCHFMVDEGKDAGERMRWLVDTHLRPPFEAVLGLAGTVLAADGPDEGAHVYYALVGAASMIFAVAPECAALTGVDPLAVDAIERHAELVARLFVPG